MAQVNRIKGLFRRFRAFVLGREVEVVGRCLMCGRCCRHLLLKEEGRFLRREEQFEALCEDAPEHRCFTIIERSRFGVLGFACTKLGPDNMCSDYESRPALCGNYPVKSLYYQGGWLRDDCGYSYKPYTFRDALRRWWRGTPRDFASELDRRITQENTDEKP